MTVRTMVYAILVSPFAGWGLLAGAACLLIFPLKGGKVLIRVFVTGISFR